MFPKSIKFIEKKDDFIEKDKKRFVRLNLILILQYDLPSLML
jgi:hypothetical protein